MTTTLTRSAQWTFVFHESQRERFRDGSLVSEWRSRYPHLFDKDDERVLRTEEQRRYHFLEWLAAVLIYEATGYLSFVEKYSANSHPVKRQKMRQIVPRELDDWLRENQTGQPDLLVYHPMTMDWFFCEVKGPGDKARSVQREWMESFQTHLPTLGLGPSGRLQELRLRSLS